MAYGEIAAIVIAVTGLVSAIAKFVLDFYRMKHEFELMAASTKAELDAVAKNVQKIETATNSMMEAMLLTERKEGRKEGAVIERSEEKQRQDEKGSADDPIHVKLADEDQKKKE